MPGAGHDMAKDLQLRFILKCRGKLKCVTAAAPGADSDNAIVNLKDEGDNFPPNSGVLLAPWFPRQH